MTTSELGRKAKHKFPQYSKLSDEEAGQRIAEAYPEYRKHLTDFQLSLLPVVLPSGSITPVGDSLKFDRLRAKAAEITASINVRPSSIQAVNEIDGALDASNVNMLGVEAMFRRLGSQARAKYNDAQRTELNNYSALHTARNSAIDSQIRSAYALSRLPEQLAMESLMTDAAKQLALTQTAVTEQTLRAAFSAGWADIASYQAVKSVHAAEEIRLVSRQAEIEQDIDKADRLNELARRNAAEQARTEIDLSTTASLARRQQEKALRKELREAYERQDTLTSGTNPDTGKTLSPALKVSLLREVAHDIAGLEASLEGFRSETSKIDTWETS